MLEFGAIPWVGSISAAFSSPVYVPGEERRLFSQTAAGNRAYPLSYPTSMSSEIFREKRANHKCWQAHVI